MQQNISPPTPLPTIYFISDVPNNHQLTVAIYFISDITKTHQLTVAIYFISDITKTHQLTVAIYFISDITKTHQLTVAIYFIRVIGAVSPPVTSLGLWKAPFTPHTCKVVGWARGRSWNSHRLQCPLNWKTRCSRKRKKSQSQISIPSLKVNPQYMSKTMVNLSDRMRWTCSTCLRQWWTCWTEWGEPTVHVQDTTKLIWGLRHRWNYQMEWGEPAILVQGTGKPVCWNEVNTLSMSEILVTVSVGMRWNCHTCPRHW